MNTNEFIWWASFRENLRNTIENSEYKYISELHAKYFNHKLNYPCKCNPKIIQSYIDDLNELFLK